MVSYLRMFLKLGKGQLAVDRSDIEVQLATDQKLLNEFRDYRRFSNYPIECAKAEHDIEKLKQQIQEYEAALATLPPDCSQEYDCSIRLVLS